MSIGSGAHSPALGPLIRYTDRTSKGNSTGTDDRAPVVGGLPTADSSAVRILLLTAPGLICAHRAEEARRREVELRAAEALRAAEVERLKLAAAAAEAARRKEDELRAAEASLAAEVERLRGAPAMAPTMAPAMASTSAEGGRSSRRGDGDSCFNVTVEASRATPASPLDRPRLAYA